jgi:hypothetical protein
MYFSEVSPSPDVVAALAELVRSRSDCVCEPGLSQAELTRAETEFGLQFAPTWRAVLGQLHPVAPPIPRRDADGVRRWTAYPDWRIRDRVATQEMIDAPVGGLLFDVERNGFWWRAWGLPPSNTAERVAAARARLLEVPRLTPLWSHLYLAATDASPCSASSKPTCTSRQ